ncbi:MAG: pilin [Candidatus Moraniibacteriota bacterium]
MLRGSSKIQKQIRLVVLAVCLLAGWASQASAAAMTEAQCNAYSGVCRTGSSGNLTVLLGTCSSGAGPSCYAAYTSGASCATLNGTCKSGCASAETAVGVCTASGVTPIITCCSTGGNTGITEKACEALQPVASCVSASPGAGYVDKGSCTDVAGTHCWQTPSSTGLTEAQCKTKKGSCVNAKPADGYIDLGLCSDKSPSHCWQPPSDGGGGGGGGSLATISFPNPLKFDTFQDLVMRILSYLQGIIVLLALVFIVIGGVLYITSGGSESRTRLAKDCILAAMIGLAIGIGAPTFLREIVTILCTDGGSSVISCPIDRTPIAGAISLWQILLNTLNFLLGITGVLAVIMFVIGGVMYLTSAGSDKRVDTAKDIIKYSLIGIIVVLAALVIVKQLASLFT